MGSEKKGCFVTTIDLKLAEKLRTDLASQGFLFSVPPYTVFSAQKKGISCTLYSSGKLTVQGKEMEEFITFYLEPEILQNVSYSYPEAGVDMTARIGIDESGKGDFFGPLCVAGVYAETAQIKELLSVGVKDSKSLSDASIKLLSAKIKKICPHALVYLSPPKYNELYQSFRNLNRLLAWGHTTAIAELVTRYGCQTVIIDQFASEDVVENALRQKKMQVALTQRHRAESDPVVAAASILARAAFLNGMEKLSSEWDIELPKGASPAVKKTGKALVAKHGQDVLQKVGKLHFKTRDEILND